LSQKLLSFRPGPFAAIPSNAAPNINSFVSPARPYSPTAANRLTSEQAHDIAVSDYHRVSAALMGIRTQAARGSRRNAGLLDLPFAQLLRLPNSHSLIDHFFAQASGDYPSVQLKLPNPQKLPDGHRACC